MAEKINRYAQIFKGELVFIVETFDSISNVAQKFTHNSLWVDITNYDKAKLGSRLALTAEGEITFTEPNKELFLNKYVVSPSDAINYAKIILKNKTRELLDTIAVEKFNCPSYADMAIDRLSDDKARRINAKIMISYKDQIYNFIDSYVLSKEFQDSYRLDFVKLLELDILTIQDVFNIVYSKKPVIYGEDILREVSEEEKTEQSVPNPLS